MQAMRDIDQISYRRGLYAGRGGLPRDPIPEPIALTQRSPLSGSRPGALGRVTNPTQSNPGSRARQRRHDAGVGGMVTMTRCRSWVAAADGDVRVIAGRRVT